MGRYTIHQIPTEEIPPLSKNAARKLEHPPGSFAAYHPDPLLTPGLATLPHWDSAARAAEAAINELEQQHGDSASRVGWVLQRSESVGSSTIEDVNPSLRRVARAEAVIRNGGDPHDDPANEALGNIAATRLATEIGDAKRPITLDDLLSIHSTLMDHTSKPELGGHLRPNWIRIGGVLGGYPPPKYVAPPAEKVPELMDDLLEYINTTDHRGSGCPRPVRVDSPVP
ncbi:Fic family protein [Candidatus Poriferisocius sp.]|uniref:Fic family protein n=1 Tax=Candidatus Poriferisocius sp. TaxID=3101276 RepID=UPI003B01BFB2